MTEFLRSNTLKIYRILIGIVLIGKISNWFLNYSDETNKILSTAMFCLIGIAYLSFSWAFDKTILKLLLAICGMYLIIMNFIPDFSWNSIIGIVCILTPMIIGKFFTKEDDDEENIVIE
jgi:uncharacterized membrane protein